LHWKPHAPERYVAPLTNRAVVSDNDRVFHAVGDFARPDGPASSDLTPTSEVVASDDGWALRDGARAIGTWPRNMVWLSVSWKAYVFRDEADATRYDEHTDDLDEARVIDMFSAEMARRGAPIAASSTIDESFLYAIAAAWPKRVPAPSP
jgi:hypothetical protein